MAAVRRSRGSGTLIALVVFVLLTFIAIGGAVYYAMQYYTAYEELKTNQQAFKQEVAQYYRDQGWELPTAEEPGVFDVQYGSSTYSEVSTRLQDAATFQKLSQATGWKSPEVVTGMLSESPLAQNQDTSYETASGLLQAYERVYEDQQSRLSQLNRKVSSLQEQLKTKDETLNETQQELRGELEQAADQYQQKLEQRKQKYQELLASMKEQRNKTEEWRQRYRDTQEKLEQRVAELQQDVTEWREMYRKLRQEGEEERLRPDGKVLAVKPQYSFLIVTGGQDRDRQRDQRMVVYTEDQSGKRIRKATLVVTEAFDVTSRASILQQQEGADIDEGDLITSLSEWEEFEGSEEEKQASAAQ